MKTLFPKLFVIERSFTQQSLTMKRRCIATCLALSLAGFLTRDTYALGVSSAADLINLFDNPTGDVVNVDIEMLNDLDFSSAGLTAPLGVDSKGRCAAYSGLFQGNGHSIKGYKRGYNEFYKNDGLFCSLKDATIENVAFDSSCSFNGNNAGALAVNASGPLTVINVTNEASVKGKHRVGGFIGSIEYLDIGNPLLTFNNCTNNGVVSGNDYYIGGFVGYIFWNEYTTVLFSNCTNNGSVSGNSAGGFIGGIRQNEDTVVRISSGVNHGKISGGATSGGFVGSVTSNGNSSIVITNGFNNGNVTGRIDGVGGLVGFIYGNERSEQTSLHVENSANLGYVLSESKMACGLFCVKEIEDLNYKTTVLNSINKGTVETPYQAYGITNNVTKARNIVSMGTVNGSLGSYTFWKITKEAQLFYGLTDTCVNCTGETQFKLNTRTGRYEIVNDGGYVNDLLNEEAVNKEYGMVWTSQLELVDKVMLKVEVRGLITEFLTIESGKQLGEVEALLPYSNEQYGFVDCDTGKTYSSSYRVSRSMIIEVVKKRRVTIGNPINKDVYIFPGANVEDLLYQLNFGKKQFVVVNRETWGILALTDILKDGSTLALCHNVTLRKSYFTASFMIEHQTPLQTSIDLVKYCKGYHMLESDKVKNQNELFVTHTATADLDIALCFLITVDGYINTTFFVEDGKEFCDTTLKAYFSFDNYFEVVDSNTSFVYVCSDIVLSDMNLTVNDQCGAFAMEKCKITNGVCTWDTKKEICERKQEEENNNNKNVGVIVGVCVGSFVIIVCVVIIIVFLVLRKKKGGRQMSKSDSESELN